VTIPSGATYGFYVGLTSGSVQYTNGTGTAGVSTWFSNNTLTVTEGLGGGIPKPNLLPSLLEWNSSLFGEFWSVRVRVIYGAMATQHKPLRLLNPDLTSP